MYTGVRIVDIRVIYLAIFTSKKRNWVFLTGTSDGYIPNINVWVSTLQRSRILSDQTGIGVASF